MILQECHLLISVRLQIKKFKVHIDIFEEKIRTILMLLICSFAEKK